MCRRLHGQKLTQGILHVLIAGSPCTATQLNYCALYVGLYVWLLSSACFRCPFVCWPCQDYSKWGKVLQSAGPTTAFFLILMKSVLQSLPDVFVHENVTTFPMDHIVSFLGRWLSTFLKHGF
jgi:hypothetical protein